MAAVFVSERALSLAGTVIGSLIVFLCEGGAEESDLRDTDEAASSGAADGDLAWEGAAWSGPSGVESRRGGALGPY